uniref:Uncharacterized protein n=1 Tax=Solibacter usitatus (strain Ellin6076) TaxID=234267 RepID=Q022T1_SOLUE
MPKRKTKSAAKPAAKSARSPARSSRPPKVAKPAPKPKAARKAPPLDLSVFPPESVAALERRLCLACVLDVFTRHLHLAARTAHLEIKRFTPSIAELYAPGAARPWFEDQPPQDFCPYCGSASKWHTRLLVYRIESGKATDALRRELVKSLPQSENQFLILEEKATQQHAFFEWLDKIGKGLDLEDPAWLREISRHYLGRKEPKTDWTAHFGQIHSIRRSRHLVTGWEIDNDRLFLAPHLFDELLLVQYLVSRSYKAGGLTFEGRYTLQELFARLRRSGYLRALDINTRNPADALEQLVAYLSGGESAIRFYHIVDRRDFLEKVKSLRLVKPPKPKAR